MLPTEDNASCVDGTEACPGLLSICAKLPRRVSPSPSESAPFVATVPEDEVVNADIKFCMNDESAWLASGFDATVVPAVDAEVVAVVLFVL